MIHVVAKWATRTDSELFHQSAVASSAATDPAATRSRRQLLAAVGAMSAGGCRGDGRETVSPLRRMRCWHRATRTSAYKVFRSTRPPTRPVSPRPRQTRRFALTVGGGRCRPALVHSRRVALDAGTRGHPADRMCRGLERESHVDRRLGPRPPGRAEAAAGRSVSVESLQHGGRYRKSTLSAGQIDDGDTMLAFEVDGQPLHADHGYPLRLIAPNRPGVLQTKWVGKLVVG